ncbi:hypothetical protein V6767_13110 [Martelella sp. FLE1502]
MMNGFVLSLLDMVTALATAVGEFVQSTFDRRAAVLAAIAHGSVADTAAIDAAFADPEAMP